MLIAVATVLLGASAVPCAVESGALFAGQNQDASVRVLRTVLDSAVPARMPQLQTTYGITIERYNALAETVTRRVLESKYDHVPGISISTRASSLKEVGLSVINDLEPKSNELLRERMVVQALYDWTRTRVTYNLWLGDQQNDREVRKQYWNGEDLIRYKNPTAVCAGFSDLFWKMLVAVGIESKKVDGMTRRQFDNSLLPADPNQVRHSWVLVRHSDGTVFPVDPTNAGVGLQHARALQGRISQPITFPVEPRDWAMHLTVYYPTLSSRQAIPQQFQLVTISYREWLALDVTPLRRTHSNLTGMTWFKTATVPGPPTEHLAR